MAADPTHVSRAWPLISLPAHEPIAVIFQRGLMKLGVEWMPSLVVSSLELIENYVANGFGIGVSVSIPGAKIPGALRRVPLPGFDALQIGVMWGGQEAALVRALVKAFEKRAGGIRLRSK